MDNSPTISLITGPEACQMQLPLLAFYTWDLNSDLKDLISKNTVDNLRLFGLSIFFFLVVESRM